MSRQWIAEITCIATKTFLVDATSRKDAMRVMKSMDRDGVEGVGVEYGSERAIRIIREDKPRKAPKGQERRST